MIADLDQAPKERVEKPVWRVAFFGRLEERKGIKLFVDAVQVLTRPCPGCMFACTLQAWCADGDGDWVERMLIGLTGDQYLDKCGRPRLLA